jgi:hypothetical protein
MGQLTLMRGAHRGAVSTVLLPSRITRSSFRRPNRLLGPLVLAATVAAIATFAFAGPLAAIPANTVDSSTAAASTAAGENAINAAEARARAAADDVDAESAPATGFAPIAPAAAVRHVAPAAPVVVSAPSHSSSTPARSTAQHPAAAGASPSGYGCGPALAYLRAHAAPGFTFQCPGYSYGHQAMTCVNHAPQCAGERLITITVPCAAAYMNEAHNSWVLIGQATGIDPYGWCH